MMYKIILNNKNEIIIDDEDYKKFEQNITSTFVRLKQAVINPSYVIAIIPHNEKKTDEVDGYVDEATGKFIVTDRHERKIENAFSAAKEVSVRSF